MSRDVIRRYGYGSARIPKRIILQQGIPVIQVRLNFVEYFTRIYDRRELYKRLLVGESLDALCPYSRTSRGSTVSSGATRMLVMGSTLLLIRDLTLTNSYLIWFDLKHWSAQSEGKAITQSAQSYKTEEQRWKQSSEDGGKSDKRQVAQDSSTSIRESYQNCWVDRGTSFK